MKTYLFALLILLLPGCSNNAPAKEVAKNNVAAEQEKLNFFPVTTYLKGQIYSIKEKGLTPVKYTTINNRTDSVMIKFDQLNELLAEFLHPEIDSASLIPFFTETKFLDQTIDAFTFTYEPKSKIPDSIQLMHWDVYIEPETGKVKRIYILKKIEGSKTLQLTWQSNKWCKTITIGINAAGASTIEKEEKISWDY